eukprot:scaffold60839_cov20-Tisochrysis_lutea.AAC.2
MNHMRQLLNHANVSAFQEVGSEGSKHGHSSLAFPCWLCTTNATAMLITKAKEHYWVLIQLPYLPSSVARYLQSSEVLQQASVQDVSDFLLQHNNKLFSFVSELMGIMLAGEDQSQADQPNSLAEGPPV